MNVDTPGPGNYKVPSELGHYVAKGHEQMEYASLYGRYKNFKNNNNNPNLNQ